MSDEELVQCPNNPNHQVPRSQINEHVKTCKFLIDPNQETQITFSSYDEPRPSTSYQESPQEGSSHQGGRQLATLPISGSPSIPEWRSPDEPVMQPRPSTSYQEASQEGSSQQGGSQMATLPIPESTSFREWRSPKKTEIQETSPSKLKRLKPYPKPLKSKEISAKSVRGSSKSDLSSDKQSKKGLLPMRKETYLKELSRKRKDLKKLKIDSNSEDNSSSSTDSALSLEDTMSENKKIILYEMGLEFKSQIPSTSQQTDSSQQAASSQQAVILQPPKLTLEKKDEKMDDESSVDPSSRFLPEPSDPLEFEMEEPSLPGDIPQEQSESVSSYAETSDDSIDLQRLSRKRKMEHEKMDTEEIVEVKVSHLLAEVTTPLEVELEESSSSEEVPLQQSQPFSFHAALSYHSDVSDQPKMISKKKREEIDTEKNIVAEASHTLAEVATQLEVEMEEPSLAADVPQQQLQSVSTPTEAQQHSDRSQQSKMTEKMIPEKIDTEENIVAEASPTSSEVITQLEVELEEPSLVADVPQQQLQSVSSPTEAQQHSDRSQHSKMTEKMIPEKIDTEENIVAEASPISSEVITQFEVELEEPSLAEEVPLQQLQPFSFHAASTSDSDVSQQPEMISKNKHEEMDTEEKIEAETSHTLSEVTTQSEVGLAESNLSEEVPLQQLQPFSFHAASTSDSDVSQQPEMISKNKHEEMDTEEKIEAETSPTSSEVTTQSEVGLAESNLAEEVPLQQLQPFSFHAASTSDSDVSQQPEMISKNKHEEMDTEEKIEAETSHTLSEVTTQSEVGLAESNLSEEVPLQQLQPFSFHAASTSDSDVSQQPEMISKNKHEEMDTEEKIEAETSPTSSEVTTQSEVGLAESNLSEEVPLQQLQPFSFHAASTSDSDVSQQPKMISKKKHEETDTEEKIETETSHTLSEVTTESEVGLVEPSSSVPKEQSKPVSSPAGKTQESVRSERQSRSRKKKYEELMETDSVRPRHRSKSLKKKYARMYTEEKKEAERSHLSTEETTSLEVVMEEPSSSRDVPEVLVSYHGEIIYDTSSSDSHKSPQTDFSQQAEPKVDVSQVASMLRKRSYESSEESTDDNIGDVPNPATSPKSYSSSETDSSQRKKKCLNIRKLSGSSSTTDEDKGEKIGLEKPSTSSLTKQSKPVVSPGKTKHQLDVPQVTGRLRKRSYEMSDTKLAGLDDPGSSYQTHSSQETDSSPNKIKKRSDSSSSTGEDKDEKKGI